MNDLLMERHCEQHDTPPDYEGKLLVIKPEKLKELLGNGDVSITLSLK